MKNMKIVPIIKKHKTGILLGTGIGSSLLATAWACKNTLKMPEIITVTKDRIEEANAKLSNVNPTDENYTDKENRKEKALIYIKMAGSIALNYLGPAAVEALGFGCILKSNKILRTKNKELEKKCMRLSGTCAALYAGWNAYREEIKELIGEEAEYKIYHNIVTKETEITDENGKKKKIKKEIIKDPSMYDVIISKPGSGGKIISNVLNGDMHYDHTIKKWVGHDYLLLCQEAAVQNERLEKGHSITYRDIFKRLKLMVYNEKTGKYEDLEPDWAFHVGWDPKNRHKNEYRDDYIKFRFHEAIDPLTGEEAFALSLNPDGVISETKGE